MFLSLKKPLVVPSKILLILSFMVGLTSPLSGEYEEKGAQDAVVVMVMNIWHCSLNGSELYVSEYD